MKPAEPAVERRVGVEHEYCVFDGDEQIDFRTVIHDLPTPGRRIDPGDTEAYRTLSGLKITCDGREAEIATPPIVFGSGFVDDAVAWTGVGGEALDSLAGDRFRIEGGSTHISVSMSNELAPRAAGMFARTFAPALMLLMDADTSPGLLVRPRFGRLEFGAEFVTGERLAAAVALAAGATIVCESAAASFLRKSRLPPPVRVDVVRSVDRYGWYVGRDAFGLDLYETGRASVLKRELVGRIPAQRCLEHSWEAARAAIVDQVADSDLSAADDIVAGRRSLPLEAGLDTAPPRSPRSPEPTVMGRAMAEIETPSWTLAAVAATWEYVVFGAHRADGREAFVSVPEIDLDDFIGDAHSGRHDDGLGSIASESSRTLATFEDAARFGYWNGFVFGPPLAPPERGADGVERYAPP